MLAEHARLASADAQDYDWQCSAATCRRVVIPPPPGRAIACLDMVSPSPDMAETWGGDMVSDIIENSPRQPRRGPHLQARFLVGTRPARDMPLGCIGAFSRPRRHRPACVSGCPEQAEAPELAACGSRTHRHSVRIASKRARQTDARQVSVPKGERCRSGTAHAAALHHRSPQQTHHTTRARSPVMRLPPRSRMLHSTQYVDSTRCHDGMGYCVTRDN